LEVQLRDQVVMVCFCLLPHKYTTLL